MNETESKEYPMADGVPVMCSYTKLVDTADMTENPRNPNRHPKYQLERLAEIIQEQGWRQPITVSTLSGHITKGHGRLAAARLAGLRQVPVDFQDYESEAAEWADMVADNRIAELSEIDADALLAIADEMEGKIATSLSGYTADELEELTRPRETETPAEYEISNEYQSEKGDANAEAQEPETSEAESHVQNQYGVVVACATESAQEETYNKLTAMNFECKVVAV